MMIASVLCKTNGNVFVENLVLRRQTPNHYFTTVPTSVKKKENTFCLDFLYPRVLFMFDIHFKIQSEGKIYIRIVHVLANIESLSLRETFPP